ncbi:MAG: MarR family transcriptional regulator [Synergistaceae bacterium]|nr:MarR family transcriptional regulator [Synergistaceae bacterium]
MDKINEFDSEHNVTPGSRDIGRLIIQLKQLERTPRKYGGAGALTPSEVHVIDAIGCGYGISMGKLAAYLGVSKGAVTQIVKRMESKGFVERSTNPDDFRSVIVSLKEKGVIAYKVHKEMHVEFYRKLREKISQRDIDTFEFALRLFDEVLRS